MYSVCNSFFDFSVFYTNNFSCRGKTNPERNRKGEIRTDIRTDLALEKHENLRGKQISGVSFSSERIGKTVTSRIEVLDDRGSEKLGKPVGTYYTVETEGFPDLSSICDERLQSVRKALRQLIPDFGTVLVAGLGNPGITPDALGPKCASMIFSTRHIDRETARSLGLPPLREVCAVSPGVTGQTGLEAVEIIAGICKNVKPAAVITVDALASGSVSRLANTVQMSSVGIEPGSGVGNARKAINRENLGVPVIAVGVPTVVDAVSLARDVSGSENSRPGDETYASFMVTPRNIDSVTDSASRFLALAINGVLHPQLSDRELLGLM